MRLNRLSFRVGTLKQVFNWRNEMFMRVKTIFAKSSKKMFE